MRLKPRRRVVVPAKPPEAPPTPKPTLALDDAWGEASALYANRKGMKLTRAGFFGLPSRLLPDRVAKLKGAPGAKRVRHLLGLLSDSDLRVFHTQAAIGLEQATAAARTCLIVNVSAPIGFLVLLNSLLPGSLEETYFSGGSLSIGFLVGTAIAAVGVPLVVWYAFAGVQQARDLYHLATLEMARRGLAATLGGGDQNALEAKL